MSAALVPYPKAHRKGYATWIGSPRPRARWPRSPLQLATGAPAMTIGGFSGRDPAPTRARFVALVRAGTVGYHVARGFGDLGRRGPGAGVFPGSRPGGTTFGGPGGPAGGSGSAIAHRGRAHGKAVDTGLNAGATLYDLSAAASG